MIVPSSKELSHLIRAVIDWDNRSEGWYSYRRRCHSGQLQTHSLIVNYVWLPYEEIVASVNARNTLRKLFSRAIILFSLISRLLGASERRRVKAHFIWGLYYLRFLISDNIARVRGLGATHRVDMPDCDDGTLTFLVTSSRLQCALAELLILFFGYAGPYGSFPAIFRRRLRLDVSIARNSRRR